ncbi:MFS transporter [Secundilactobacillus kimchicus]|uniref:MFS transporter n=1 Tax=Secundilactobacillus kimchicus TaxID=528209 RepID=UPI00279566B9|nr:MFS transporter [Secundilactobacillus kimchicus]
MKAGSFIADWLSWKWTFFVSAGLAFVSVVLIAFLVTRDNRSNVISTNPLQHYVRILKNRRAWLGLVAMLLWMYCFYAVYTYLGLYVETQFSLSVGATGLVFVAYGVSNFISSFTGGWIGNYLGMRRAVTVAGIISILAYLGLGIASGLVAFVLALAVLAFAQGIGAPQLTTHNATVLTESRTTMTSLNSSFLYLGLTVGSSLGGVLYQNLSFLAVGTSAVIATLLALYISRISIKQ